VLLKTYTCKTCGKEGCDKCLQILFYLYIPRKKIFENWYCHNGQCWESFTKEIGERCLLHDLHVTVDGFQSDPETVRAIVQEEVLNSKKSLLSEKFARAIANGQSVALYFGPFSVNSAPFLYGFGQFFGTRNRFYTNVSELMFHSASLKKSALVNSRTIETAKNFERAGRFEDAARCYDVLEMYDEAGRAREKERGVTPRTNHRSVDLSSLLRQIQDGGLVAVYRCPRCGGNLNIGEKTNIAALSHCEHCGSIIKAVDLADFLKALLS